MPKKVILTTDYMRAEAHHIHKEVMALQGDINQDGHKTREALKKKIVEKQHEFFKKCKEKEIHTK